jgi:hypothetical protein
MGTSNDFDRSCRYRLAMVVVMITVEYLPADWDCPIPDVSWGIKDAITGEDSDYNGQYFAGLLPPHYPVPAIRYQVEIQPDRVILWERIGLWSFRYLALN